MSALFGQACIARPSSAKKGLMTDLKLETEFIRSKDGTELFTVRVPKEDAQATLLFIHGFGEHIGRYSHVFQYFHDAGYDITGFDYRGHGKSHGHRGYCTRFREYLDDVDAAIAFAMEKAGPKKLYLVGHSFGGLITANYVLEQPEGIDGIALSGPAFGFAVKVPAIKAMAGQVMSRIYPKLALPTGIPLDDLSTDKSVGVAYGADPLVLKNATARWYTEALLAQERVLAHADRIQLPVVVLQGADDRVVAPSASQNFIAAVGSTDKELFWYEGMYHEIFNEVRKADVFTDLLGWLKKH